MKPIDNTANLISKLNISMHQFIVAEMEKRGIVGMVPSHGTIILSLLRHESLTMNELAKTIGKDPSTVTTLVKKLTNLGYTNISKNTEDKRANIVSLTSKGKALEDTIYKVSEDLYQKQFKGISQQERAIFRSVLETMIANFLSIE